jgi:ketosteroid isomerase-like protein
MSDQNVDVVKSSYAAFGRGDLDGLLATLDPAVEWVTPGPADLPTAGARRGHDAVRGFFKTLDDMYEILRFEPKTFIAQGEHVIVLGEDTARIKATGTVVTEAWVHHMTIRNGKVVAFREYLDTAEVVAELRMAKAEA